ncbi:MAG: anthranilate phosphoribosyltransferase [Anaerofustis sp.]
MEQFSTAVTKLIQKQDLSYDEMIYYFKKLMNNEETEMHQGAFLSALAAKGESPEEIKAVWQCIMDLDTVIAKPEVSAPLVENSGTGMDRLKTFNISSLAALCAASEGVVIARHGARAMTSKCGAIDVLENAGVFVDAPAPLVKQSIEQTGIGIYNGMSPQIHPNALGRILSQISFGTVLNVAASLANPAIPEYAVRGVYEKEMLLPVANIMKEIGYRKAYIICGLNSEGISMIDEASTIGDTAYAYLGEDGRIEQGIISPESVGIKRVDPDQIRAMETKEANTDLFMKVLCGKATDAQTDITALNAGLILMLAGKANSLTDGVQLARDAIYSGKAYAKLEQWVSVQDNPENKGAGKIKLDALRERNSL